MAKEYSIHWSHRGHEHMTTGTLDDLIRYFGYKLECGHSWNAKIPRYPKTFRSLVSALNRGSDETQGACYDRDSYWAD